MSELTLRQILDAIGRAREISARQFAKGEPDQMQRHRQATVVAEEEPSQRVIVCSMKEADQETLKHLVLIDRIERRLDLINP